MMQDSKFKYEKEKYENASQKKVPDFRKSKRVSTMSYYKAVILHKNFCSSTQGLFMKIP